MHCYRCYAKMVTVTIVDKREREHHAKVCTKCGRIYSKDWYFKEVRARK